MQYLGIDLGTTFSLVAYVNAQGVPALFPDYHDANEFRTPSVIHIGEEGCLVGQALEELLEDEPALTQARFVKLGLGKNEPLYTDHKNNHWLPPSLSALILKKLMRDVEAFLHEEVNGVVISVPANFNDAQRKATKHSAILAGLPSPTLIEEPIAAATYYGFADKSGEQTLFVYDLGGGTFDATVLQSSDDGLYALATEGTNEIGGKGVDELIMAQVAQEYQRIHNQDPMLDPVTASQLRRFATDTKLALAKPGRNQVRKTLLLGGKTLDFVITRLQFETMINDLIDETIRVSERCLDSAGLDWMMIDKVLLTGGSSLLPLVTDKIAVACGKPREDIVCKQPHQAVAYGAALIAEQRNANSTANNLQRISAYELGVRARNRETGEPMVQVLVKKNMPVPAAESTTFYTTRDDQFRMVIEVVQQKAANDQEKSLGYFIFGIEEPRKNYPVEITLAYDLEGMVKVTAKDPETGTVLEQIMDEDGQAMDQALMEQKSWVDDTRVND
ncbi:Hsp70 family protein [Aliikangiella sp. IMCC44653]